MGDPTGHGSIEKGGVGVKGETIPQWVQHFTLGKKEDVNYGEGTNVSPENCVEKHGDVSLINNPEVKRRGLLPKWRRL